MEALIESFTLYYGLDWLAMLCGLFGTYLISKKSKWAFVVWICAATCGFTVASISSQFGFLVYNGIAIWMYMRSLSAWKRDEKQLVAAE